MKSPAKLLIIALLLWMCGSSYWYACKIKGICSTSEQEKNIQSSVLKIEGGEFNLKINGDIMFGEDSIKVIISDDVKEGINKLFQHLDEYTTHGIEIIGNYDDKEENTSLLENLGLARAQSVKNILLKMGLDRSQIATTSASTEKIIIKNGMVSNVISLRVYALEELSDEDKGHLAHIEKVLRAGSKFVYFKSGEDKLELNDELRTYLSELSLFMHHHAHHSISLVGHTDDVGGETDNEMLGLERANFVKQALVEAGIQAKQIQAISKGESEPIASNETEEGRRKDRRVEIIMN